MPKKVHEINPFHGGINNKDDQRDLTESQLVEALNVKADSKGTLKVIGNLVQSSTAWTSGANSSTNVSPGFGFYRFSSDAASDGASGLDTNSTNYLIAWSEDDEKAYWWNGSSWAEVVDLTSWTPANANGGRKPVFSYANGELRICDSNFNNLTNENHWLGHIKRHIFKTGGTSNVANNNISEWFNTSAKLTSPDASQPAIQSTIIASDGATQAEDVTWSISNARDISTLGAALSDDNNGVNAADAYRWEESSNGTNSEYTSGGQSSSLLYRANRVLNSHPYDSSGIVQNYRIAANLSGNDVWSESGFIKLNTTTATAFTSALTISPTGSIYVTMKLEDQASVDAWNGGMAVTSETTVVFRNLKIALWNAAPTQSGTSAPTNMPTANYISWDVSASDLIINDTRWFVLELPYDRAMHNDLSGTTINQIEFAWDTAVTKSGSDSYGSAYSEYANLSAFYACDLRVGEEGLAGTDFLGNQKLSYSFTYGDKRSESLLTDIGVINMGVQENTYSPVFQVGVRSFTNKRITGACLYTELEDIPYLIAEVDFVKGLRGSWDTQWPGTDDTTTQWTNVATNSVKSNYTFNDSVPLVESFQARNGYNHKQDSISARYKSIVITNNRAYVGNVHIDGKHHPDKMIKSQTFDYDVFPEEGRSIEVVQQDGDSIITLAAYADRIFQYKKNKLHVVNITSEQEFLEDSHTGLGVSYPYHVVSMSSGIAWFNENGAYYFNGKGINNITNGLIDDEIWKDHVANAGDKAQIFYVPRQDKIMVVGGLNGVDVYEYTIYTEGWTKGSDILENTNYTNFSLDVDNIPKVFKPSTGYWYEWSNDSTILKDDYKVVTGDLVFDSSAVRKKIYSVHVTHRNTGGTNILEAFGRADRAGIWTNLGALNNYSDYTVQEFDVSGVNNARSYQVKIEARNLVTNGYFDTNTTGWNPDGHGPLSLSDGKLLITSGTSAGAQAHARAIYTLTTVAGQTYRVKGNFYKGTADQGKVAITQQSNFSTGVVYAGVSETMTTDSEFNFTFVATATTHYIILHEGSTQTVGDTTFWDNISVKQANIPNDFEVNDINIVYRSKNVR